MFLYLRDLPKKLIVTFIHIIVIHFRVTYLDFIIVPFYLLIIYWVAFKFRTKHYHCLNEHYKFFIPGLTVKLIGGVLICLVYIYYFGYGDTLTYFNVSKIINSSFNVSFSTWCRLITHSADETNLTDNFFLSQIDFQDYIINNYLVSIVGSLIGLICFDSFICTALLTAAIAYTGYWALFRTFFKLYPSIPKQCAFAALFIPSVALWGSGLFKDTICMCALGWLTYNIFYPNNYKISNILGIIITATVLFVIKVYILAVFLPFFIFKMILDGYRRLANSSSKLTFLIINLALVILTVKKFVGNISVELSSIVLENFSNTVNTFSNATIRLTEDSNGSGYSLGELDGSLSSILVKIPAAINVTLFRPYIWEAGKAVSLEAALEALLLTLFTAYLIFVLRVKFFIYLFRDSNLLIFVTCSILFAFVVGITTSNFGTLNRFKIPCLPFYTLSLFVLHNNFKKNKPNAII